MNGVLKKAVIGSLLTIGVATAAGAMGRGGTAAGSVAAPAVQAPVLPDGDGKKFVTDNCGGCHGLDQVAGAKHDLAVWSETLSRMATYGADIPAAQLPTVAAYLAKNFTANPPKGDDATKKPDDAEKAKDAAGEKILNDGCTTCHDLGPITRRADDRAAWESVVYGMIGNGADVKDADIPTLVDYLVKYYGPAKDAPKAATPATPAAPAGRGGRGARGQ